MNKELQLSEKGTKALAFLQANTGEYTVNELADVLDLEVRGIHGVMRPLVSNGLVYKTTRKIPYLEQDEEGAPKEVLKETKVYAVTEEGSNFVIA